jgi:hypothetical protein
MEGCFSVVLGIEGDVEAGLSQREEKEFALAGAVFDQEDGGMAGHRRDVSARNVPGLKIKSERIE